VSSVLEHVEQPCGVEVRSTAMSCQLTGCYADLEVGIQPARLGDRLFDIALGRSYFRGWSKQSLAALQRSQGFRPASWSACAASR
jgi:hypothetical protein